MVFDYTVLCPPGGGRYPRFRAEILSSGLRSDVLTVMIMKNDMFWDVTPCSLIVSSVSAEPSVFNFRSSTMKMEAGESWKQ
jgi:hypothetical protein